MTKSRKIGISVALTLVVLMAFSVVFPLLSNNANVAHAVVVESRDEWENSYSGTYYDNLNLGLRGADFRSELARLITSTHTHQTSYDELKTVYKTSDADPKKSGNIIWFYTGTSTSYNGTLGSSSGTTNREHVWAKNGGDTFPPQSGPGADAHHLRPTEALLNGARSNYGFGIVTQSNSNAVKEAGSLSYGSTADELCYLSGGLFYPAKGYRGATARILFYMQVRWGDANSLYFVDGQSTSNGKGIGKITDLMRWHLEEPPTDEEIRRNNAVFSVQHNRNPFIDHPEFAEMIYCNGYDNSYSSKLQNIVSQVGGYLNSNQGGGGDVKPEPPTLQSITLSPTSLNLTVGHTSTQITVTPTPANASNSVTWSTSNSSVATVSDGVVTAVGAGTATITATSVDNPNISASVNVTVTKVQLQSLAISPNSLEMSKGNTRQLTVTATPTDADNRVTWSTSNSSVATVSDGVVTAVGTGTATITATSVDNPNISASVNVTVTKVQLQSLAISPNSLEMSKGNTRQLTVTATPTDADSRVTWSTSDSSIATVTQAGMVSAVTAGTATITATSVDNPAITASITVTVISQEQNAQAFVDSLEAIEAATTLEARYNAIKRAIDAYYQMSDAEKFANAAGYDKLQAAINAYNNEIELINSEHEQATNLAAQIMVNGVSVSFMALVAIVIKRLLGR